MLYLSADHHHKRRVISKMFMSDLMVVAGLMVVAFGSLLPALSLSAVDGDTDSFNFTEYASQVAASRIVKDQHVLAFGDQPAMVLGVSTETPSQSKPIETPEFVTDTVDRFVYYWGWLDVFVDFWLVPPVLNQKIETPDRVLGVIDHQLETPVERISPWLKQNLPVPQSQTESRLVEPPRPTLSPEYLPQGEFVVHADADFLLTSPVVIEYVFDNSAQADGVVYEAVDRVEFLVDGFAVTNDRQSPFFLGGDMAGGPIGYHLEPGSYVLTVRVYFRLAPENYLERSMIFKVE